MVLSGTGRKALSNRPMTGGTRDHPSADQIDAIFAPTLGIEGDDAETLATLRALPPEVLATGPGRAPVSATTLDGSAIVEGVTRGRLMSRWKVSYCILSSRALHCGT
jgi:hypothetical protein